MPRTRANGIELEYEVIGDSGEPIVLIMGIGAQMIMWPDGFCQALVDRGFQVIRFDNREVGKSTRLHHLPVPDMRRIMLKGLLGFAVDAPYTLVDMADDVAGLMDALDLRDAHVVGCSLGGMVAQTLAIVHPHRLRTLTSMMSTSGKRWTSFGKPRAIRQLLGPPPRNRDEAIERHMLFRRVCGSTKFEIDWDLQRDLAGRSYDRGFYPRGFVRQMAAAMATGDRTAALRFVRTPTLVMHGSVDPLIPLRAGIATARAIPGAKLKIIDGMGHDMPRVLWPTLTDAIAEHAAVTPCAQHVADEPSSAFRASVPA